ncbi:MAG: YcgN family cysteine cluster protein [Porticoccaceae bacterium]|nr:YcgN family cysteine cluster protein [Porticoccaceae bacterium]
MKLQPWWEATSLADMTDSQWESLCDGCAKCCLVKLEDYDSAEIYYTNVTCQLLDTETCRCSDYAGRHKIVDDCIKLDRNNINTLSWLPKSCSYRLIADGKPLPDWHHLRTGDAEMIHAYGASLRGRVVSELEVKEDDIEDHIIKWID